MRRAPIATLAALALACTAAAALTDPYTIDPAARWAPPGPAHWLGADDLGRDVLARVLHGGRVSLAVGLLGAIAAVALGGAIGLVAGYTGGLLDALFLRLTDAAMALPRLPLILVLLAIQPRSVDGATFAVLRLVAIVAAFGWMAPARIARAEALRLRGREYVLAARALGAPSSFILRRHVLPNALPPLLAAAALEVGEIVLYESALGFLGLGVPPPVPSWGTLLQGGLTALDRAPLSILLPGILCVATVASASAIADDLRAALDPRT